MRAPQIRAAFADELVIDCFAGGGGASSGIELAIGRHVDIAINHNAEALAMHRANHPNTRHYQEDIWDVDPKEVCAGRPVGLAWFSPDCTHHSRAKGAAVKRSAKIRALSWVVIRWARAVRPRVICLENVEEIQTWGPLDNDGKPIKAKAGKTFNLWVNRLRGLGYAVEFRSLVAADYGTPTTRRRLFMVARCDGQPIVWPKPTHGKGRAPWRAAAEIIDWSLPCPSIFDRRRPLAEATLKRIAVGIQRFVIGKAQPFTMPVKSWGGGGNDPRSIELPMRTVTAAKRGEYALVEPFTIPMRHTGDDQRVYDIREPMRTVTSSNRGEVALVEPFMVGTGGPSYSGKPAPASAPLGTILPENHRALVEPFIVRHGHYSTITGAGLREGCGVGTFRGQPLAQPLATVCATNDKHLVAPIVTKHYGGVVGHGVDRAIGTITAVDHHSLSAALLQRDAEATDRSEQVRAFLLKWYGTSTVSDVQLPLPTVLSGGNRGGGHLGIVIVHGEPYRIVDIGMRMLVPRELFAAQGFPPDYIIDLEHRGKPLTKTAQTRLAGNSVCRHVAEAIVRENGVDYEAQSLELGVG